MLELGQPGQEAGLISERRSRVVIGVASLPVGQDHHPRSLLANHLRDLQPIFPGVFHPAIGDVEGLPPANFENPCRSIRLPRALFGGAARSHLTLRKVEDAGAMATLGHLQQRAAAGLFHVVTVGSNRQDVERPQATC